MAEIASSLGKSTRVADFAICEDDACTFPTTLHLVIRIDEVPLHRENAVAISYAWGEFDRQRRLIGHFCDGREVSMELGSEWILRDAIERLAELSENKALWIDQLCMPQKEDQVAKALADIPSIFRTLDVVILMPGNPCGCIPDILDEISKIPIDPNEKYGASYNTQVKKCLSRRKKCLGWGVGSWVRRLWPRQELMFSQRVRCVWTSKEKRKCITQDGFQDPRDVPAFSQRMIHLHLNHYRSYVENAQRAAWDYMYHTEKIMLTDYCHYVSGSQGDLGDLNGVEESFLRFLLGTEACNGRPTDTLPDVLLFIFRLQIEMGSPRGHNRVRREATRHRDYVISIWTACPGYEIPDNYKSMSFADLLQNAVDQLQKKHHTAFATTAPRGLFGFPSMRSALWNPAEYLSAVVPASDVDVYRTLSSEGWAFYVNDTGMVPISIRNTRQPALSMKAFDYHALIGMCEVELKNDGSYSEASYGANIVPRLVESLQGAMKNWGRERKEAVESTVTFESIRHWLTRPMKIETLEKDTITKRRIRLYRSVERYLKFFLDHGFNDNILDAYRQHLEPYINPFHLGEIYDAIYMIVAAALELDVEYCEKKGVKLIFHPGDGDNVRPRVGFSSGDIKIGAKSDIDFLTVSMTRSKYPRETLLYEACSLPVGREQGDSLPYYVFAVWVPTESTTSDEYGAKTKYSERWAKGQKQGVLV